MGPIGCPKTSPRNYHSTPREIPKERISQVCLYSAERPNSLATHRDWSLVVAGVLAPAVKSPGVNPNAFLHLTLRLMHRAIFHAPIWLRGLQRDDFTFTFTFNFNLLSISRERLAVSLHPAGLEPVGVLSCNSTMNFMLLQNVETFVIMLNFLASVILLQRPQVFRILKWGSDCQPILTLRFYIVKSMKTAPNRV